MGTASDFDLSAARGLYDRAVESLPGGNTRTTVFVPPHPPYAVRGSGCRVEDEDGHSLLDLLNNYTALIHGHAHPTVVAAAVEAVKSGASFGLPTRHEVELADLLTTRVPAGERWRFTNSGTEAVMMAIRAARAATGRDAILRFEGCYHGTYDPIVAAGAPGVPANVADNVVTVPVGDLEALMEALGEHGERLACVVFDAMPNRAGLRPATPEFVHALRAETQRLGILLLQDEVLSFRVAYGGVHSLYDIAPDLITLGKVIGGGFPIGAVGGREDVMAVFDPRTSTPVGHGGTFSANPVTMRAGLVAMELLTLPEVERINALGDRLREALGDQGWTVTGNGSLLRVLVDDATDLWWRLYREGVLLSVNGLACISTPMRESDIDFAIEAFARVREKEGASWNG